MFEVEKWKNPSPSYFTRRLWIYVIKQQSTLVLSCCSELKLSLFTLEQEVKFVLRCSDGWGGSLWWLFDCGFFSSYFFLSMYAIWRRVKARYVAKKIDNLKATSWWPVCRNWLAAEWLTMNFNFFSFAFNQVPWLLSHFTCREWTCSRIHKQWDQAPSNKSKSWSSSAGDEILRWRIEDSKRENVIGLELKKFKLYEILY